MKISIIIPVLNEEHTISKLLDYLDETQNSELISEVIVVDGGSTDTTLEILKSHPSIKVIHSPKGRSVQMNIGAKTASCEAFYFLHCDSFPPDRKSVV